MKCFWYSLYQIFLEGSFKFDLSCFLFVYIGWRMPRNLYPKTPRRACLSKKWSFSLSDKSNKCCSDTHYNTWHCCWTWIFHVPVLKKEWYFLDSVVFFIILHGIVTKFEFFLFLFSIIVADILWKISAWLILSSWKDPVFRILPTINLPRVGVGTRNWSSV